MAVLRRTGIWIAFAALLAVLPLFFESGFALTVMCQMGVLVIFSLAYNMLLGQGGMLSFGHAVYFGLAGYFTVHFVRGMHAESVPFFPISLLPLYGGLVGLVFGVLIGYVSTRRAGTAFAMISLGFGEMATALTLILVTFFNGEEGIQMDRWVGPEPLGITYGPQIQVYYLIAVWCLVATLAMFMLTRTPFGRMSNAVRDNAERVEFVGYNTQRVRWLAFSLSSFFAGIAGALHAINLEHIGFETVSVVQSGQVLFMTYIGGVGHFFGPMLGAVLITILNSSLSGITEAWFLYLGLIFVIIVMFAPGGLAGLVMMHEPFWRLRPGLLRDLLPAYLMAFLATLVAAVGIIGLIEMLYRLSLEIATTSSEMSLFFVPVDAETLPPWLGFGLVAGIGIALCRLTYRVAGQRWHAAQDALAREVAR